MSPHQRALILAAPVVKSRRIKSARAAADGSAMVVFFHRFGARPVIPAERISRATRLRPCRCPRRASTAWTRGAVAAPGLAVDLGDLLCQIRIGAFPRRRASQMLVK